jgi:hypothetical protein
MTVVQSSCGGDYRVEKEKEKEKQQMPKCEILV